MYLLCQQDEVLHLHRADMVVKEHLFCQQKFKSSKQDYILAKLAFQSKQINIYTVVIRKPNFIS